MSFSITSKAPYAIKVVEITRNQWKYDTLTIRSPRKSLLRKKYEISIKKKPEMRKWEALKRKSLWQIAFNNKRFTFPHLKVIWDTKYLRYLFLIFNSISSSLGFCQSVIVELEIRMNIFSTYFFIESLCTSRKHNKIYAMLKI